MGLNTYLFINQEPDERLEAKPIESDKGDSWVRVQSQKTDAGKWLLGLTPDQALDLAESLVACAFQAKVIDKRVAAELPQPA